MIKCKDLASVMTDTDIHLKINNKTIEDVNYGKELERFGDCIVTKIKYLNCDTISVYATDPNKISEELENEQTEKISIHKKTMGKGRSNRLRFRKRALHKIH